MNGFNKNQAAAIRPGNGIHLVIAGPGTGKTRTMIERIRNTILEYGTDPGRILILTFSRKAAEEIRERLAAVLSSDISRTFAGTFHSFCLDLLKKNSGIYIKHTGMVRFPGIIDSDAEEGIMKKLFMRNAEKFIGLPYDAVMKMLNSRKVLPAKTVKRLERSGIIQELEKFIESYNAYKKENSLIDYADMTGHAIELLRSYPQLLEKVQSMFDFIFVDEYQDTSVSDYELISLVSGRCTGLFMVGDDCQSIYRFRGARYEYIVNAGKFFPDAAIHKLTINYRSRSEIVDLSNRFIKHNRFRTAKKIVSASGKGGIIRYHESKDITDEPDIINSILSGHAPGPTCALLCRNNWQIDRITHGLNQHGHELSVLTMHSSKGLEFDVVIIAGVADSVIPDRDSHIEDERRLFYVALTRAKIELHIIYRRNNDRSLPVFIRECGYSGK